MSVGTMQRPCCGLESRRTRDLGGPDAADDGRGWSGATSADGPVGR